jgi:hypothetical protein
MNWRPFLIACYAAVTALVLWLLLPFFSVALYSAPASDDFCISSLSIRTALGTAWHYYLNVTGRLPALTLIALPSAIVRATGLNLYLVYPLVNVMALAGFIAASIATAELVFMHNSRWPGVIFGCVFAALALSLAVNLVELIYWVTGEACYLVPTIGLMLLGAWFYRSASIGNRIGGCELFLLATALAFVAMFNEFTVFYLVGIVAVSQFVRRSQFYAHLAMLAACVVGYCVILFSPSNAIRLLEFPHSGDIPLSFQIANVYVADYWRYLIKLPSAQCFAVLTACFALATAHPIPAGLAGRRVAFGLSALCVCLLWVYTAYFIGAYGTGGILPLRARNEVIIVFLAATVIAIVSVTQALVGFIRWPMPAPLRLAVVLLGTCFIRPVWDGTNYVLIRREWPQLATFWRETVARDALLSRNEEADVVVPRRTVTPLLLMGDD